MQVRFKQNGIRIKTIRETIGEREKNTFARKKKRRPSTNVV